MVASEVLEDYGRWLSRQALAERTRTSYRRWVAALIEHLAVADELTRFLEADGDDDRRAPLADWRRRLVDRGLAATVNLALAAASSLLDSRALPVPRLPRVEVDPRQRGR